MKTITKTETPRDLIYTDHPTKLYLYKLFDAPAGNRTRMLGSAGPTDIHYHTGAK